MWRKVLNTALTMFGIAVLVTAVATAVNADNAKFGPPGMGSDNLTLRVAQILGIDQNKLANAYMQAAREMETQRTNEMFAAWVSAGKLTQAQADAYKVWLAARPDGIPGMFGWSDNTTREGEMLDKMLKDGRITQAQYSAIKAWLAQKPAITLPQPEKPAQNANVAGNPGEKGLIVISPTILEQLLKDGKITQDTYNAYKAWLAQKPSTELPAPAGGLRHGTPPVNPPANK